jgi:outer membrane immunogenic protein
MKRLALAFALTVGAAYAALAADLPTPGPVPPPIYAPTVVYNWTGFYIGGNLGLAWNGGSFADSIGNTFSLSPTTLFLGGAQVGFNYQFGGGFLVGAETDFDWLSNTASSSNTGVLQNPTGTATGSTGSLSVNNRLLTTVVGRVGYAWDRVLLYGKGGFAWVSNSNSSAPFAFSTNSTSWGGTGGIGVEWAFAGNWSVRAEYDFIALQNQTLGISSAAPPPFTKDTISINNRTIQIITAGVNYKLYGPGAW